PFPRRGHGRGDVRRRARLHRHLQARQGARRAGARADRPRRLLRRDEPVRPVATLGHDPGGLRRHAAGARPRGPASAHRAQPAGGRGVLLRAGPGLDRTAAGLGQPGRRGDALGAGGHRARHGRPMTDTRMSPTPRRAKLELLVRRDGDDGFDVRQVASATAFVQSRPQPGAAESWELVEMPSRVAGKPSFILKNPATDRFLLLTEPERFLWQQMDGQTSLQEIATAYVLRYGAFDFDIIPTLMRKLQRAQLLT